MNLASTKVPNVFRVLETCVSFSSVLGIMLNVAVVNFQFLFFYLNLKMMACSFKAQQRTGGWMLTEPSSCQASLMKLRACQNRPNGSQKSLSSMGCSLASFVECD